MARQILLADVIVSGSGYVNPTRTYKKGQTVELSAAEITAIGAGNLRVPVARDNLGLGAAVTNSD